MAESSLSFVFVDFFPPTDRGKIFEHFLGQKLFLLLSSGLPPSILSPEASNPQHFTQAEEPEERAQTTQNRCTNIAQVLQEYVCRLHTNTRAHRHSLRQWNPSYFCLKLQPQAILSHLPLRISSARKPRGSLWHIVYILYYFSLCYSFCSHSCIEGRQQIDLYGCAVEKQAKEAAQVQEPYMYRCSRLETDTVLKAESAVFFRNFVYTTFARFSDIAVQYSPRADMQSCRGEEAAQAFHILGCMTAPPTGQNQADHAVTHNGFWIVSNICSCRMMR